MEIVETDPEIEMRAENLEGNLVVNESLVPSEKVPTKEGSKLARKQVGSKLASKVVTEDDFIYHYELGKGTYGCTYLVTKINGIDAGKRYAIKISKKENMSASLRELTILKLLNNCTFTVKLVYSFQDPKVTFLCLNLLHDTLEYVEYHLKLDRGAITFYATEILCGIKELHQQGILHRDLKPSNILLSRDGHISISDFGGATIIMENETARNAYGAPLFGVSYSLLTLNILSLSYHYLLNPGTRNASGFAVWKVS